MFSGESRKVYKREGKQASLNADDDHKYGARDTFLSLMIQSQQVVKH